MLIGGRAESAKREGRAKLGLVAVVAGAALLSSCASESSADVASDRLGEFFGNYTGNVASVEVNQDQILVAVRDGDQWPVHHLYPEVTQTDGGPSVALDEAFPVDEFVARVEGIVGGCDEDAFKVRADAVVNDALLTSAWCGQHVREVSLNQLTLEPLTGGWTAENLQSIWEEITLLTPDHQVEKLHFNDGRVVVELLPIAGVNEECRVQWNRDMEQPEDSRSLCLPPRVQAGAISLEGLTADDVAGVVLAAGSQGIESPESATVDVGVVEGVTVVTVVQGSRRWSQEFTDL